MGYLSRYRDWDICRTTEGSALNPSKAWQFFFFFLFKTVHIGCGTHRPFCVIGTGSSKSGVKQPLDESDPSLQSWWGARMREGRFPPPVYASWRGAELAVPCHSGTWHPAFKILVARIRYHLKKLHS